MYSPPHFLKLLFVKFGFIRPRYIIICLSFVFVLILMCSVHVHRTPEGFVPPKILECYSLPQVDKDVVNVHEYEVLPNSIFFVETSCRHGGGVDITKRQACAYESAAKVHPDSEVLVLFPSPVSLKNPSVLVSELLKYPNLKFMHIDTVKYFLGTPLEKFNRENRIKNSLWPVWHMSDILRYLTLWKYGGTYLDSDTMMIRPINTMDNFVGAQSRTEIAAGVLNFNISNSGRQIADEVLLELRDSFRGRIWANNGPGVISRVLRKICKVKSVQEMTPEKCHGFSVFPPLAFYPIPYQSWQMYFKENASQIAIDVMSQSFGFHIWGKLSSWASVKVDSGSLYTTFASKFCPKVYSVAGEYI